MKLSIIIPVYHEQDNITAVLDTLAEKVKTPKETLIIYDSEDDPTVPVLNKYIKSQKKSDVRAVANAMGNGRGVMNAIKTGLKQARGDAVVVVMADLSDDISQIDQMYELVRDGWDIVCASRYMRGGRKIGGPPVKTALSWLAGMTLYYIFRVPTHDSTNAFKMYNRRIFDTIAVESTGGFEYSMEIVLKAHQGGFRITQIPTVWRDREAGQSSFQLLTWLPLYIRTYLIALRGLVKRKSNQSL